MSSPELSSLLVFASDGANCTAIQAEIDSLPSTQALLEYLKLEVVDRRSFTEIFGCMGGSVQRMPTDLIPADSDKDYIYGAGWFVQYSKTRFPDRFISRFGRFWWDGKIFAKSSTNSSIDDEWNVLPFVRSATVTAKARNLPSVVDGRDCVVVDYRTVNIKVGNWGRDDLRDVIWQGKQSRIYAGGGYYFKGSNAEQRNDTEWEDITNWNFGLHFVLDLREEIQANIPAWTARRRCCD